ncbi:hypothetical protein LCGC14_2325950 [marine sediment metagenome]|uniref:Uncharacterized protein n=1 Tax=marine sediment metagenome TaxID=412755 RepID=A0A0F9CH12_9ZZZZ
MKLLWLGIAMVVLGAIFGNPVPWALMTYTECPELHYLARIIGMVSAVVFLSGFVVLFGAAGYYSSLNR